MRYLNFNNLLKVLDKKKPEHSTLFEFSMCNELLTKWAGEEAFANNDGLDEKTIENKIIVSGYKNLGYDYANIVINNFTFKKSEHNKKETISINEGEGIWDRESYKQYNFNNPDNYSYKGLDILSDLLIDNMKLTIYSPGGLLENVIAIVGYENLCMMLFDDEALVAELFDEVGARLYRYYENCIKHKSIGALVANDDWGFKTQTMLPPEILRKYVFPWHKKLAYLAHSNNKPAILHSCGYPCEIMEDIIENMKYDGKHSYEDSIVRVEKAYSLWGKRIAILGGIDLNFLCTKTPVEIGLRAKGLLELTKSVGYALGSGNSIPYYIPQENYNAMREMAFI